MSKKKAAAKKPSTSSPSQSPEPRKDGMRETIESVVIAFVLAFLFRTFEAEAFVIPTGSMAPTLMGRHKDLKCEKCGFAYQVNASGEVDKESSAPLPCEYTDTGDWDGEKRKYHCRVCDDERSVRHPADLPKRICPGYFVVGATCPVCRYPMSLASIEGAVIRAGGGKLHMTGFPHPQEVSAAVKITLDGKAASLTDLKEGYPVRAALNREGIAAIDAKSAAETEWDPEADNHVDVTATQESFKGDRILVAKFPYEFSAPERWDVFVFRFPEKAQQNFIKRLIGLPLETVLIRHGDIHTAAGEALDEALPRIEAVRRTRRGVVAPELYDQLRQVTEDFGDDAEQWLAWWGQKFTIQRKPPDKVLATLQTVHDNDHLPVELLAAGDRWTGDWEPVDAEGATDKVVSRGYRSGSLSLGPVPGKPDRTSDQADGSRWLRYEHLPPTNADWDALGDDNPATTCRLKGSLITDFSAFNSDVSLGSNDDRLSATPANWVGDLALECQLESESDTGRVVLELVEAGWRFQCRIDLASGAAQLAIQDPQGGEEKGYARTADTAVRGKCNRQLLFANVDNQLILWVDGDVVEFKDSNGKIGAAYDGIADGLPTAADLSPVGIAAEDGAAVNVSHLRVWRDIYYIATSSSGQGMNDYDYAARNAMLDPLTSEAQTMFDSRRSIAFALGPDDFLALGDNSAKSMDSRLWYTTHTVSRDLLIGKALYIYWPHSFDRITGTNIWFPMFPNFGRMGFVR